MPDKKISALTAGSALGGTEKIPMVQSSSTVYTTPAAIKTYLDAYYESIDTVTSPVSWTPTFTGFGTVSGVTAYSWRVGSCLHFEYRFQSGSSTSTEARVSIGFNGTDGNVTTANSYPTLQVIGHGAISNSVHSFVVMAEASKTYITFGLSEVYNLLVKRNGSDIANSSSVFSFKGSVRIQGW